MFSTFNPGKTIVLELGLAIRPNQFVQVASLLLTSEYVK